VSSKVAPAKRSWSSGTPVEVRNRFTAGWAAGFVIERACRNASGRYRLRRVSDGAVLPAEFSAEDLRPR
jgi:hypothetical protein